MNIEYDREIKYLGLTNDDLVHATPLPPTAHNILSIQKGYRHSYAEDHNLIVDKSVLDEHYTVIDNMNYVDFDKESRKYVQYKLLYKSNKYDYHIAINMNLSDDWETSEFSTDKFKLSCVYYPSEDFATCEKMIEEINYVFKHNEDNSSKISIVLKTMSGYTFKQQQIKPLSIDVETMYNDDFAEVHEHIVESLTDKSKGIILLHGKAGTGKTNYIKHLTTLVPKKKFIFIPVGMIPFLTDPSFLSQLADNKGIILVLEDCENYLKDRESGENSVVSTILNLSDGILSDVLGIQIIATFNADLGKVDEALLRKGRLIDEYDFKELSVDKCKHLLKINDINEEVDSPMTLAEVFNTKDKATREQKKSRLIGFGR